MTRMREWLRVKILHLIADDIDRIACKSYDDGCYVTRRQLQAEETMRLRHIIAENERLREMLIERANLTVPPIVLEQEQNDGN